MKRFKYEQYDYDFLCGMLSKKQRESLQIVLNRFIGCPNTEMTRYEVKYAIECWLRKNDIKLDKDIEISF